MSAGSPGRVLGLDLGQRRIGVAVSDPDRVLASPERVIQRSGARDLDRAALEAVRGWRFQPAHNNGQPMQATLDIPFDFKPAE